MALGRDGVRRQLAELMPKAQQGDREAAQRVMEISRDAGILPDLCEGFGSLATRVQRVLVKSAARGNPLTEEALTHWLDELRSQLAGSTATPLEKLLVERIVVSWLQVYSADLDCTSPALALDPGLADFHQKRQDRAHRRYLMAIRELALVRRLLAPACQVNLAERQVNVLVQGSQNRRLPS